MMHAANVSEAVEWAATNPSCPMHRPAGVYAVAAMKSVYTASKAAVNAFTECLALEAEPFGIRVRIVLPGRAPDTAFGSNARGLMTSGFPEPYAEIVEGVFARWAKEPVDEVTHAVDVAEAVWRAATDPSTPMRLPAGVDAVAAMGAAERVLA